jgi:hypothetical protein
MEVLIGAIGSVNQSIAQRLGVTRQQFPKLTRIRAPKPAKHANGIDQALERSRRGLAIRWPPRPYLLRLRADPESLVIARASVRSSRSRLHEKYAEWWQWARARL